MLIGEGDGITEDYIKTVPTRVQAAIMVLRLNGVDADAAAFTGTDNFADASLEAWAMPYLAYLKAHKEFGLEGTGNNMFEKVLLFVTPEYGKLSGSKLKAEAQKLIDKYRERYSILGVHENTLYPGIKDFLEILKKKIIQCFLLKEIIVLLILIMNYF